MAQRTLTRVKHEPKGRAFYDQVGWVEVNTKTNITNLTVKAVVAGGSLILAFSITLIMILSYIY